MHILYLYVARFGAFDAKSRAAEYVAHVFRKFVCLNDIEIGDGKCKQISSCFLYWRVEVIEEVWTKRLSAFYSNTLKSCPMNKSGRRKQRVRKTPLLLPPLAR